MIPINLIRKSELISKFPRYISKLENGVIIAPTDTLYGLSCNAKKEKLIKKIRKLKKIKTKRPFSVIAPSKKWIRENCVINPKIEEWLKKLPGPYTLILKLKNKKAVAKSIINKKDNSLGVRIPDHWISNIVRKIGVPLITTTVNVTGKNYMTSLEDLNPTIKQGVDLIISVGNKKGRPSTLVNLVDQEIIEERLK